MFSGCLIDGGDEDDEDKRSEKSETRMEQMHREDEGRLGNEEDHRVAEDREGLQKGMDEVEGWRLEKERGGGGGTDDWHGDRR